MPLDFATSIDNHVFEGLKYFNLQNASKSTFWCGKKYQYKHILVRKEMPMPVHFGAKRIGIRIERNV